MRRTNLLAVLVTLVGGWSLLSRPVEAATNPCEWVWACPENYNACCIDFMCMVCAPGQVFCGTAGGQQGCYEQ